MLNGYQWSSRRERGGTQHQEAAEKNREEHDDRDDEFQCIFARKATAQQCPREPPRCKPRQHGINHVEQSYQRAVHIPRRRAALTEVRHSQSRKLAIPLLDVR